MAQPFFRGNFGSALARVDTRPIMEAGRAQGAMYANLGGQIGGMIKEYGLNKQKRAKLTGEIEAYYDQNPEALSQIGMSGDEVQDKKDFTEREKFVKGDMSMAQLEGYAGKLARGEVLRSKKLQDESRVIQNEMGRHNLGLSEALKDSRVNLANNQSELSDLALKYKKEADPKKKALLFLQIENSIADLNSLAGPRRELAKKGITESIKDLGLRPEERRQRELQFKDADGVRAVYSPSQRAASQKRSDEESILGARSRRLYTDRLPIDRLPTGSSNVDTSIPGNVDISKALKDSDAKVARLRDIETSAKDDDEKVLKISDVLVPDLPNQGFKINEEYLEDLTEDDKSNIDRLIRAIAERSSIADQELVEQVVTNPDGTKSTRTVTAAEDRAQQEEYDLRTKALERKRLEEERSQKYINDMTDVSKGMTFGTP